MVTSGTRMEPWEWAQKKWRGLPGSGFCPHVTQRSLLLGGGGGALRDGTKTAARKTSEEEAVIPIL